MFFMNIRFWHLAAMQPVRDVRYHTDTLKVSAHANECWRAIVAATLNSKCSFIQTQ